MHQLREKLRNSYGDPDDFFGFSNDGMKFHENSLELENYLSLNRHRKKKLNLTNSENNSSNKKSSSNANSNKKNFNKKNLIDEGNNTEDKPFEENKEEKKDKEKEKEKDKEKKLEEI